MSVFYRGDGAPLDLGGAARIPSRLNGADVIFFGDSNVYYSAGRTTNDVGSIYQRLSIEFSINSWTNKGSPGKTTWQGWLDFSSWATDEIAELYNKESTILLFGYATNDALSGWSAEYVDGAATTYATNAVHFISRLIAEKFPKAQYHWIIPPETDWSKWTGSSDPDDRNMAEKMPYIIKRLEEVQLPYCDMYHTSGITSDMLSDGIHMGGGGEDYTTDAVYKYYRSLREYLVNK